MKCRYKVNWQAEAAIICGCCIDPLNVHCASWSCGDGHTETGTGIDACSSPCSLTSWTGCVSRWFYPGTGPRHRRRPGRPAPFWNVCRCRICCPWSCRICSRTCACRSNDPSICPSTCPRRTTVPGSGLGCDCCYCSASLFCAFCCVNGDGSWGWGYGWSCKTWQKAMQEGADWVYAWQHIKNDSQWQAEDAHRDLLWLRDRDRVRFVRSLGLLKSAWPALLSDPASSSLIFLMAGTPPDGAGLDLHTEPGETANKRAHHEWNPCMKIHPEK